MQSLKDQLTGEDKRKRVVDDALVVLDQEVGDKGGLTGMAIRGAYKVVRGVSPGFLRQVVEHLLDDFLAALEPVYAEAAEKRRPTGAYVVEQKGRVANALLGVTDRRAQGARSAVVKSAYQKLRPIAEKQVEAAAPRLGALIERHAVPTA